VVDLVDQSLHALAYERDKKQEQVLMMIKSENFHFVSGSSARCPRSSDAHPVNGPVRRRPERAHPRRPTSARGNDAADGVQVSVGPMPLMRFSRHLLKAIWRAETRQKETC